MRVDQRSMKRLLTCLMLVPAVLLWAGAGAIAQGADEPIAAPLNPDFLERLDKANAGLLEETTADGYGLGAVPGPVDLSHAAGQSMTFPKQLLGLPASYDLRTVPSKLPPVRNQGGCGSCWAFAAYGSLESCLRPAETWDFSEMDLICSHGFDYTQCYGGEQWMSTAYLARWDGPVNESCYPYASSPYNCTSPRPSCAVQKHVQQVIFIPGRATLLDNDNIKNAVMNYGAVQTVYYHSNSYYNSATYAYYCNTSTTINHGVCVVGWDDNYSASNFLSTPPGNGAFIIRNSWGPGWGESGYFYISYYDMNLGGANAVFLNGESTSAYNHQYSYDPLGWVGNVGYNNTSGWGANVFTTVASESLLVVSTYASALNTSYTLYVYKNPTGTNPRSGTLATSQSGTLAEIGYHTITLNSPVSLTVGQTFSVVISYTTPGYKSPIPCEFWVSGYTSGATANLGEGYISFSGSSWTDVHGWLADTSVCIKAFTGIIPPPEVVPGSWRSVKNHDQGPVPCGPLPVPLDEFATTDPDTTTEPRLNGLEEVRVDFTEAIQVVGPLVAQDLTNSVSYPATVSLTNSDKTLVMQWAPGLPNLACYYIDLSGAVVSKATGIGLAGDADCYVATLEGDTNDDHKTDALDRGQVKVSELAGDPATLYPRRDVNLDCKIDALDRGAVKVRELALHEVVCP